jgi:hypothetical protein
MITRLLFILFCVSVVFLGSPQIARACGCYSHATVLDDFEQADIVLIARIVSLDKVANARPRDFRDVNSATMVVEKVYKGAVQVNDKLTFAQGDPVIGCHWNFLGEDLGHRYLLYLDPPEKPSDLWYISTCYRSTHVEDANQDLLDLNNMDTLRGHTRVSGVLGSDGLHDESVEGRKIRIVGRKKTYIATTDKNGFYELYDLPPGKYLFEPELQFGWKVDEFKFTRDLTRYERMHDIIRSNRFAFTLRPKRHFGISFTLRLSNHVSGTVYDSSSNPIKFVCVSFVPPNDESDLSCNSLTDELGRFQIDSVAAGTYAIILTYQNKTTKGSPFPKLYYPGVTAREKAEMITVKHGENVNDLRAVIPK